MHDRCIIAGRIRETEATKLMEQDDGDNQAASLPDDLLANILGRLAPRWLAVSRCVCKAWQAAIHARRLLLLPRWFGGIFLYFTYHKFPELFARPMAPAAGKLHFLLPSDNKYDHEEDRYEVQDHCNGLLLLQDAHTSTPNYIVNPATRRRRLLPDRPPVHFLGVDCGSNLYLVFDPAVSPHNEVFMIPYLCYSYYRRDHPDPLVEESEWPPATCILNVYSSRTRLWEPRSFDREGDALGTVAEMRLRRKHTHWQRRRAVFWGGTLYVHCEGNFLMRISLSTGKCRAIKLPTAVVSSYYTRLYLGRSENGVYFASLDSHRLRVWILNNEPCGQMEWMLKHDHDLLLPPEFGRLPVYGPWLLEDINYDFFCPRINHCLYGIDEPVFDDQDEFEWSSDDCDDEVRDTVGRERYRSDTEILGFHPFREIIFLLLNGSTKSPVAYHFNSFKAQVLGNADPTAYCYFHLPNDSRTVEGFPYTPCLLHEFP